MASRQRVVALIERAAKEARTELDLSNNQLTSLPAQIATLTNLTRLNLGQNQLARFPMEIAKLTNLTSLNLSRNQLTSLPGEISQLTNLTTLGLGGNRISLPPDIAKLTKLTALDFWGNQLTSLPPEITNLTGLTDLNLSSNQLTSLPPEIGKLTNLTSLVVYDIGLKSLPSEIGNLTHLTSLVLRENYLTSLPGITQLTKLTLLNLSGNRLKSLPPEIGNLTNLTSLVLSGNHLTSLPPEIIKLTKLMILNLSDNRLTSVPPEIARLTNLTLLHLNRNQLESVPPKITQLTRLTRLSLGNNQLPIPPEALANPRDVKAIFAAIDGLERGERLNEAKLLVVGDPKVGKSSVVARLIYNTFNPQKETTLGVDINDEMTVAQSEVKGSGESIKLNIWDFGGQEIQHSTHQFFLTTRSLYLLVVDARKGDQLRNIEYWLKLIESFGGSSPILIVINQIDQLKGQRPLNLDRRALQGKYNIREFIETSCETGDGIPVLKATIAREVEQLKHVRDIWPREWFAIKKRLNSMQADYIPVEKYLEICGEENLEDQDLRQSLLGLLHDLGIVIRFPGDTEVLNPRWVTQGVYGLLTSKQLVAGKGQFDLKDVAAMLSGLLDGKSRYPKHTHKRLIDVMRHFELCFEFTDRHDHYIVPRHLHDTEPDIEWDDAGALSFQYHYVETLPDSIISRFIVRMNQYIQEHNYWKNGVFLHSGENRAKIKADLVDRKIFISILGKEQTRRAFLAVIRSAFDEINGNFKIEIKQMIPVPGSPQVLVSYQDLLAHEEMSEPQIVISELLKKLSVAELLDGVEELSTRRAGRERHLNDGRLLRELDASIEQVELTLRRIVETALRDDASQVPGHVLQKVAERIAHAAKKSAAMDTDHYHMLAAKLEYFDLRELQDTIASKALWPQFRTRFASKEGLNTKFDQLAELRNAIRHSRAVSEITRKEGEAAILWFNKVLSK